MSRKIALPFMFVILLVVDQITKLAVQANLSLYQSVEVIPGFFNITYVLNPGAAFGILQGHPPLFRKIFFLLATIAACVVLLMLMYREYSHRLRSFAYMAVIAGAVGNFIDRLRIDKVVDFLDVYYKSYHWYTFNFADCCITVGVALLLIDVILPLKNGQISKE